jgi:hypothetical protein
MSNGPKQSRGYRNKNPGNIDWNAANKWQGQVGRETTGNPPRFAVFESHAYGIRALAMLLTTYQDRHGLKTIAGIINRWAPGNENNTAAYVAEVARQTGREANEPLDLHTYEDLFPLVKAIIKHELGGQPYTDVEIAEGLRLAGVRNPAAVAHAPAADATMLGGAAGAATAVAPVLASLSGLHWAVGIAVVAAGVGFAAFWLLRKQRAA